MSLKHQVKPSTAIPTPASTGTGKALAVLRISAGAGAVMMALMWIAEWPLAQHTSAGAPSGSTNPLVDYHVVYALALVVFAVALAGRTWGLGRTWADLEFVRANRWLL